MSYPRLKLRSLRAITFAVFLSLLAPVSLAPVSLAHADRSTLRFSPPVLSPETGQAFTVDIVLSTDVPTRGVQLGLAFDPTVVRIDRVAAGSFYQQWAAANGAKAITVFPFTPNNDTGHVQVGGLALFGGPGVEGTSFEGPVGSGPILQVSGTAVGPTNSQTAITFERAIVARARDAAGIPDLVGSGLVVSVGNAATVPLPTNQPLPVPTFLPGGTGGVTADSSALQALEPSWIERGWVNLQTLAAQLPIRGVIPLLFLLGGLVAATLVYRGLASAPVEDA